VTKERGAQGSCFVFRESLSIIREGQLLHIYLLTCKYNVKLSCEQRAVLYRFLVLVHVLEANWGP
jgi:hypothetical protein